jgi:hypothetical protein
MRDTSTHGKSEKRGSEAVDYKMPIPAGCFCIIDKQLQVYIIMKYSVL